MVKDSQGRPTPLHVAGPVRLLLHAPPATWRWSTTHRLVARAHVNPAPITGGVARSGRREELHAYNDTESAALRFRSQLFKTQPVVLS
eukprot:6512845-Pyramimonas_sp.AAC.1